jgi:hypothetical protein
MIHIYLFDWLTVEAYEISRLIMGVHANPNVGRAPTYLEMTSYIRDLLPRG